MMLLDVFTCFFAKIKGEIKMVSGYDAVQVLAKERPDWLPIVKACLEVAKDTKGRFAGTWVLKKMKEKGITDWFPGLRLLVGYGILKHENTTRGGRRAYYTMPDCEGVEKALQELETDEKKVAAQ